MFIDMSICTGCCTTLDHIVTYVFKQLLLKGEYLNQIIKIRKLLFYFFIFTLGACYENTLSS